MAACRASSPELFNQAMPLSAYGTLNGSYTLPANANPGYYQISLSTGTGDDATTYLSFQVANYVKPQINLQVVSHPRRDPERPGPDRKGGCPILLRRPRPAAWR